MDPHERDPLNDVDPALLRALREGAAPRLDSGAPGRVADGAWVRAQNARAPKGAARWFHGRRLGLAAAAALVVAAGIVSIPSGEAAFAVEGEPARVKKGDGWSRPTTEVHLGDEVELPGGSSIVGPTGPAVTATETSVFRVTRAADLQLTVALLSGHVRVEGPRIRIAVGDLKVTSDDLVPRSAIRVALAADPARGSGPEPRIETQLGACVVEGLDQRLELVRGEVVRVVHDVTARRARLARVHRWDHEAALTVVAQGGFPVDAQEDHGSLRVLLSGASGRSPFVQLEVRREDVREAVDTLNSLVGEFAEEFAREGARRGMRTAFGSRMLTHARSQPVAEYAYESADRRVEILVHAGGRVVLKEGDARSVFPDLVTLRRQRKDIAELFGDRLAN